MSQPNKLEGKMVKGKMIWIIFCPYCKHVNELKYIGKEYPKKVIIQCKECMNEITYRDKIAEEFRFRKQGNQSER